MKRISVVFVLVILYVGVFAACANARPLPPTSDWAVPYYEKAVDYEILPKDLYRQEGAENLSREDTAEFAVKIFKSITAEKIKATRPSPFDDTNDKFVLIAYTLGLVRGADETTFLMRDVNREELCKVYYELIKSLDPDYSFDLDSLSEEELFLDDCDISDGSTNEDTFREAIYALCDLGLVQGYEDGYFRPQGPVTCEEAVVFSVGVYEYLKTVY